MGRFGVESWESVLFGSGLRAVRALFCIKVLDCYGVLVCCCCGAWMLGFHGGRK